MSNFKRFQVYPVQTIFVCNPKGEIAITKIMAQPIQQYRAAVANTYRSTVNF